MTIDAPSTSRNLHIGGQEALDGWEVFNIASAECVDHQGDASDLSRFADDTFESVYASHVAQHFSYRDTLTTALGEWFRVLRPGGKLYVSVPDLDTLATLFLQKKKHSPQERVLLMRMMFGGQTDAHDFHYVGLNSEILSGFLHQVGFRDFRRVRSFGLFKDTSEIMFKGIPVSLNMIASKPDGGR